MPSNPAQASLFQSNQFTMADDAIVTFDLVHMNGTVAPFHDVGGMLLDPTFVAASPLFNGYSGAFLRYVGDGVQDFATGAITYRSLHYELVGFQGNGASLPAANGPSPAVLATGDLIANNRQLLFSMAGGVTGELDTMLKVNGRPVGELDITVNHAATDVGYLGFSNNLPTALSLTGGTMQAVFKPLGA